MKFYDAIDQYVEDMVAEGRFTSARTVVAYRRTLTLHAEDVSNRDPRYVARTGRGSRAADAGPLAESQH